MEILQEQQDGVVVLTPRPRVDSATAKQFEEKVLGTVNGGAAKVLLDFSALDYMSSAGLRVVLAGAKAAKAKGGRLVLCGMKPAIREVFDVSGFSKILQILPGRTEALAAL